MKSLLHTRPLNCLLCLIAIAVLSACGGSTNTDGDQSVTVLRARTQLFPSGGTDSLTEYKISTSELTKNAVSYSNTRCAFTEPWYDSGNTFNAMYTPPAAVFVDIAKKDLALAEKAGFRVYDETKDFTGWFRGPVSWMRLPWLDELRDCETWSPSDNATSGGANGRVRVENWQGTPAEFEETGKLFLLSSLKWPELKTAIRSREELLALWSKNMGIKSTCREDYCIDPSKLKMPEFDFDRYTLVVITGLPYETRRRYLDPLWERDGVIQVRTTRTPSSPAPTGYQADGEHFFFQVARTSLPFAFGEVIADEFDRPSSFAR